MKSKARIYILLVVLLSLCVSSCKDSKNNDTEDPTNPKETNNTNKWIYEQMKAHYLWNTNPNMTSPNFRETDARKFYNSLRYKINAVDGDRFSYIEEYNENKPRAESGTNDLGFEYIPVYIDDTKKKVGFVVIYVKNNTNAQKEGIKRGDLIIGVDGNDIVDNEYDSNHYQTILNLKGKTEFTLTIYKGTTTKISTTPNYKDNPVFISKVIPQEGGHKIGYLMYNAFEQGDNYEFDIELANALSELKTLGITDLVVDLRYNGGGYVKSAVNLASALVPSGNKGKIFCKSTYNDVYQAKLIKDHGEDAALNERFLGTVFNTRTSIPQMNLSRVYFLTSRHTASASELVINGLTPYMAVIKVGTTTTGKDKLSTEILPKDKNIHWKLQPLIGRVRNVNDEGNYIYGLKPTSGFEIDEFELPKFGELGDPSEPLLAKAIENITGKQTQSKLKSGTSSIYFEPIENTTISLKPERSGLIINSNHLED